MRTRTTFVFFVGALIIAALVGVQVLDQVFWRLAYGRILPMIKEVTPSSVMAATAPIGFTGDVMLARDVEQYMYRHGKEYPFAIFTELPDYRYLFINFEAAVPKRHRPTPADRLTFSVPKDNLSALRAAGVTHATLANNHSYDFGGDGYRATQEALRQVGITPFGHPHAVTDESVTYLPYAGRVIAVVGLSPLAQHFSAQDVKTLMKEVNAKSDLQIAYVHWGVEYELLASKPERQLAHTLIDTGIDAVIGHHPHVAQEIEEYKDRLIFYSLGNLIFDQYFSPEVMTGLVLELRVSDKGYQFKLVPVSSEQSRAQPRPLDEVNRDRLLERMAERSDPKLVTDIERGVFDLSDSLAY